MLNWSSYFNIALVAAFGVAIVFLLASTIAVAAKGKRKCNAFDVILRVLSTLLFIASAAMLAAAVLTLTSGSYRIEIAADKPFLVWGDGIIELPVPELFVALSSSIGLMLVALLFICSLAALVVDCLVANKKTEKTKKQAVRKTPEQLKREAELDKIRRIGEDAIKRADHAVKFSDPSSKNRAASARSQKAAQARAAQSSAPVKTARPEPQPQARQPSAPAVDWRAVTEPERSTEFVGLSHADDPDFDTFDSFDERTQQAQPAAQDDIVVTERDLEPESETEQEPERETEQSFVQEPEIESELEREFGSEEERELELETEPAQVPEQEIEYEEQEPELEPEEEWADEREEERAVEPETEEVGREKSAEKTVYDEYEPDRDIYIPKIRTIVKDKGEPEAAKPSAAKKTAPRPTAKPASGASRKKTAAKTGAAAKPATKPTADKKSATKSTAAKKAPAQKGGAAARAKKTDTVSPEKKLPVTRRYVILDRRNAVNMFGEYLKDRSQAEKDKLKSSINTIIIE